MKDYVVFCIYCIGIGAFGFQAAIWMAALTKVCWRYLNF